MRENNAFMVNYLVHQKSTVSKSITKELSMERYIRRKQAIKQFYKKMDLAYKVLHEEESEKRNRINKDCKMWIEVKEMELNNDFPNVIEEELPLEQLQEINSSIDGDHIVDKIRNAKEKYMGKIPKRHAEDDNQNGKPAKKIMTDQIINEPGKINSKSSADSFNSELFNECLNLSDVEDDRLDETIMEDEFKNNLKALDEAIRNEKENHDVKQKEHYEESMLESLTFRMFQMEKRMDRLEESYNAINHKVSEQFEKINLKLNNTTGNMNVAMNKIVDLYKNISIRSVDYPKQIVN